MFAVHQTDICLENEAALVCWCFCQGNKRQGFLHKITGENSTLSTVQAEHLKFHLKLGKSLLLLDSGQR